MFLEKSYAILYHLHQSYLRNSCSRTLNRELNVCMNSLKYLLTNVDSNWLQNALTSNLIGLMKGLDWSNSLNRQFLLVITYTLK